MADKQDFFLTALAVHTLIHSFFAFHSHSRSKTKRESEKNKKERRDDCNKNIKEDVEMA